MPDTELPAESVSAKPTPHAQPENPICPSASAYLVELHQAAQLAQNYRDQTALQVSAVYLGRGSDALGAMKNGPANSPIDVVLSRQHDSLSDALYDAGQALGHISAWYAESALICLRTVLSGGHVHASDLEKNTLLDAQRALARWGGSDAAVEAENDAPWGVRNRPELPEFGALATGHADLDVPVNDAQFVLLRAYAAAELAEDCYLLTELADHDAANQARAEALARTIPDLLITFADAVAHAAEYGRSAARGHQKLT